MTGRDELRRANAILRAQQEASASGILIVDLKGNVVAYNTRFLDLWDISSELVTRRIDNELLDFVRAKVKDWDAFIALVRRLYSHPEEERYGDLIALKSGRYLSRNSRPVRFADGTIIGRAWDFADITDLVTTQQELRLKEFSLDNAADGVFWVDREGRFFYVNDSACRTLGYTYGEMLSMSVFDVVPMVTRDAWPAIWGDVKTKRSVRVEGKQRRRDGTLVPVEIVRSFMESTDRAYICAFVRDLTERYDAERKRLELERRFQAAERLKSLGVLTGGIAHDFNNLLTPILGNAGIALTLMSPGAPGRAEVAEIRTAAERAAELIKQLLAYAGKTHLSKTRISLRVVVEEMGYLLGASIPPNVGLSYRLGEEDAAVHADPGQIRQIVMNLITNAADAIGGRQGTITVATGVMDGSLMAATGGLGTDEPAPARYSWLAVSDDGVGMDRETITKIFDPFFTTKRQEQGHGLGLAALLGIVKSHAGTMQVESEPGRGSTFRVLLPWVESGGEPAEDTPLQPGPGQLAGKVLVVDDEPAVRRMLDRILSRQGLSVIEAADGHEGVVSFGRHKDELLCVFLDLAMPGLGGADALSRMRAMAPGVPVILISGYDEERIVAKLGRRDLAGFLQKPFAPEQVLAALQRVIGADWRGLS